MLFLGTKMTSTLHNITFSFYGFGISIKCQDQQTLKNIHRDFSFFINDAITPQISFEIFNEAPNYSQYPPLKATHYSPRNICYRQGDLTFIDYFGHGLTIIDHSTNIYRIFSADAHLRHEIVFLTVLSLTGQELDSKSIHRVHGLGLEINHKALLLLMPSGGGKTTLLLELLKNELDSRFRGNDKDSCPIKLISEDSPLIDRSGNALPFPIRIGVSQSSKPADIPQEHMHLIQRMEFGPKYVIDSAFFKDKLSTKPVKVQYVFCGKRCLGNESSIKPLSKYAALKELIINSVIGVGLYQGIEFLLQHGIWGLIKKSGVIFSRLKNALIILSRSRTYAFVIGCDRTKNVETFLNFCRENV